MAVHLHDVVKWVDKEFPKPRVDPEWLHDCYTWLVTTEHPQNSRMSLEKLLKAVADQIFRSNLSSSMLPGTGLPIDVATPDYSTILKGSVFVEIVALTEISHSPFDLNRVRLEREDWLKRPRNGGVEDDDEGPLPRYPRGMLKLHLSDGTTILPAIEYRSLPELTLEHTKLGFKLWLKDVRVNRGVAFLEPKTVALVGYETEERETNREPDFARWLHEQMGLPPPNNLAPLPRPTSPQDQTSIQIRRSPLRDISPALPVTTQHGNDDEELESRRRRIPNCDTDLYLSTSSRTDAGIESSSSRAITSSYFGNATMSGPSSSRIVVGGESIIFSPTLRQTRHISPLSPSADPDEILSNNDETQTLLSMSQRSRNLRGSTNHSAVVGSKDQMDVDGLRHRKSPSSSDFGDSQMDAETLAAIEAAENFENLNARTITENVITINDSDEDDKENSPVPTRHVRRRINPTGTQKSARRGDSMIPTSDIIDIPDSD